MEIKESVNLDAEEPLSKAISELMETRTAVIITKNGSYMGIIDDRNLRTGISDPSNTKCENYIAKPPTLRQDSSLLEQVDSFLLGHYKALPVLDNKNAPIGITTRVEVLKEMLAQNLVPKNRVTELMGSPVFTIDENEQISKAKMLMKEYGARRLVVVRNGNPVGVISTLDLASYLLVPKGRDKRPPVIKEVETILSRPISEFLRTNVTTIDEKSSLDQAARMMVEKSVSSIVVISGKKPVGVFSALDLFKRIQQITKDEIQISISGLREEHIWQFPEIQDKIRGVLEKFSKSFNVRNVALHVKEQKSTFSVFVYIDTDEGHVSLSGERKDLKETIDELAVELNRVLTKKKEMKHTKMRKVHSGSEGEVI